MNTQSIKTQLKNAKSESQLNTILKGDYPFAKDKTRRQWSRIAQTKLSEFAQPKPVANKK